MRRIEFKAVAVVVVVVVVLVVVLVVVVVVAIGVTDRFGLGPTPPRGHVLQTRVHVNTCLNTCLTNTRSCQHVLNTQVLT